MSFYYFKKLGPWLFTAYLLISLLLYHYELENAANLVFSPSAITISKADVEPDTDGVGLTSSNDSDLACQIPQLEPFPPVVNEFFEGVAKFDENCRYEKLFNSTLDGRVIPVINETLRNYLKLKKCCYRNFSRAWDDYSNNINYDTCYPISLSNETVIPPNHEFITIYCGGDRWSLIFDQLSFIHLKPEVEERLKAVEGGKKLNVVILGLDSVSRMHFIRSMAKSRAYLMEELKAVELTGYNKVADNTFPNIMPLLTSHSGDELEANCRKDDKFDECPFIWKLFGEKGYRTSLAEDRSDTNIFNCNSRRGFNSRPTDYYFRTYAVEAQQGSNIFNRKLCYGPRLTFEILLDNIKKFVYQMERNRKPYFQFTWSTGLTHSFITAAPLGDPFLLEMLKWMNNLGYLNNTLFILMSDHGSRSASFRNTIQGKLEDRLPLLYLVLPEWMKRGEYERAYENLLGNRERLVTTYDLHQVLLDVLNPEGMKNDSIGRREQQLLEDPLPRGISLFLPIPKERTCEMASIDPIYCSCRFLRQLKINGGAAYQAALIAVDKLNSILLVNSSCSALSLSSVIMAQHGVQEDWEGIQVNFQTQPGNATFEALVTIKRRWFGLGDDWQVRGTIGRTNLYGNQSHCVHDNMLKLYCYCV